MLAKHALNVILDSPAETFNSDEWGVDKSVLVDSAFEDSAAHCILLLDRSYLKDKWYRYRRARLLDIIFRRRGFVLPVQIGDESIDIEGLTHHLGKLKVAPGDAQTIADHFLQKIADVGKHIASPFERPLDFEKVLRLYNENLLLHLVDHHVDKIRKIGYEYFRANDPVTKQSTNFILFYEGTTLQSTADTIRARHGALIGTTPCVIILPKERLQTRLDVRLNNVKTNFERFNLRVANTYYLDEFVWQNCTPASLQAADPLFAINGFVEPSIDSPEAEGAVSFIKDWYSDHPTPVLLIRGSGGIGKTTLAQEFCNYLIKKEKKKIFFIDDETIAQYFSLSPGGFDVYDAYRALFARDGSSTSEILSRERFMLNFDSGNFLIVVDGLDQVIAQLGNSFKVVDFLNSIYPADASQRRKVIITCRSAFLPDSYFSPQIAAVDVLPFDRKQAEIFFRSRFPDLPKLIDRGLLLASSLSRDETSSYFYPFVLDIVSNLMKGQVQGEALSDDDDLLGTFSPILSISNDHDYIVYRVCARERKKYIHGLSPDDQIQCLLDLAVKHRGAVDMRSASEFVQDSLNSKVDASQVQALLAHPLLVADGALTFRYDVVRQHFRNVYVGYLFRHQIPVTSESIALLAERNKFAPEFLKSCVDRIALSRDDLVFRALTMIEEINRQSQPGARSEQNRPEDSRAKTTIFLIVLQQLQLLSQINKPEATRALIELFGSGGTVSGLSLVDVREKLQFDFKGLQIQNSEFVNYDHFWDCTFDERTIFRNSILKLMPKADGLNATARRANFDMNTCFVDKTILDAVMAQKERAVSQKKKMFEDAELFLRGFYKGGRLYPQREIHLRSKYKGSWDVFQLIKALKRAGIVMTYHNEEKRTLGPELIVTKGLERDVLSFILEDHITDLFRQKLSLLQH